MSDGESIQFGESTVRRREFLSAVSVGAGTIAGCLNFGSGFIDITSYEFDREREDTVAILFNLRIYRKEYSKKWEKITDFRVIYPNGDRYPEWIGCCDQNEEILTDRYRNFSEEGSQINSIAAMNCHLNESGGRGTEGDKYQCVLWVIYRPDSPLPNGKYTIKAYDRNRFNADPSELLGEDSIHVSGTGA